MKRSRPLRAALLANAVFSTSCASVMIFAPAWVGDRLGLQIPLVLQIVGLGLVIFAVDLVHQATRPRMATWRALYASLADFLWVVATVGGVTFFAENLSDSGLFTVSAVAAMVFAFGAWQLWGINRVHRMPESGLYRHCVPVHVNASAEAIWSVVSQLGEIQNYTPALKSSEVLDGKDPGVGAIRRCVNQAGKAWAEECVAFEPGCRFIVRFLAEAPDFPFPARAMVGGWEVFPSGDGSDVMVWWELQPKPAFLAPVLMPMLAFQGDRDFPKVIARMANAARSREDHPSADAELRSAMRPLPRFC
jgi:hypothetical protein